MDNTVVPVVALLVAMVALLAQDADACNGFRLVVKKVDTKCADGSQSIFTLKDFGVTLTSDCKFVPQGCVKTEAFKTAEVRYIVKTSTGMPIAEGTVNGCDIVKQGAENKDANMIMGMFQMPTSCPVAANERCADGKVVDITPFAEKLAPGSIKVEVVVKHDDGKVSCLNFDGALKK